MLTTSVKSVIHMFKYAKSKFSNNNRDFTSLSSSFFGLSLQNTANSSSSNGRVVDIAEIVVQDERRRLGFE